MLSSVLKRIRRSVGAQKYRPLGDDLIEAYRKVRSGISSAMLCHAPFAAVHFGPGGRVSSCCFSLKSSERYPDKSIREIWFGEKSRRLRDYMKHNDLSLACDVCATHFASRSFAAVPAGAYDHYAPKGNRFPQVMEFELDNTCNLKCIMCSGRYSSAIRHSTERRPPLRHPYDQEFVTQLEDFIAHLDAAKFYGGEPFLIDIYYDIWRRIIDVKPGVKILVHTNGTILNNKVKDFLDKGSFEINVSIDSLDKDNFERIRVGADFGRVMQNVRFFREYARERQTYFGICPTPIRQNWHEVPALVRFCNDLDVPIYFNTAFYPRHLAIWSLDSATLREMVAQLSPLEFPVDTPHQKENARQYKGFVGQARTWYEAALRRETPSQEQHAQRTGGRIRARQVLAEHMAECIREDADLDEAAQSNRLNACIAKVDSVLAQLPTDESAEVFVAKLVEYPMDVVIEEAESDRLIQLAEVMLDTTYFG